MSLRGLLNSVNDRPLQLEEKIKPRFRPLTGKVVIVLCIAGFFAGLLFSNHVTVKRRGGISSTTTTHRLSHMLMEGNSEDITREVSETHRAIKYLDKTISMLEIELELARLENPGGPRAVSKVSKKGIQKAFVVIGINTGFTSKKRRDSLRATWMPRGHKLEKLEKEKGIVIRFVIGRSSTKGGALDHAIDTENSEMKDFLRLDHVEGYHELSTKTRVYFTTVVSLWDADFYVKVDDDVHVNLGKSFLA